MCELTLERAAAVCGGTVVPEYAQVRFRGARNDSRKIEPGQLFVAIRAERDGHDFATAAMQKGAAAVLGERPIEGLPVLVTNDSLKALGAIARDWRTQLPTTVVGITGSVGKTTTKEMTAAVLQSVFRSSMTPENFNNDIGVPMTLLDIPADGETAVVEMGMNHFGELSYLTSIAQPDIAVITNIGTMHIEHLGSRQGILKAKLEILEGLRPGGTVIFNGDEPLLRNAEIPCKPVFFGIETDCDLRAQDICCREGSVSFRAVGLGEDIEVTIPVEGRHNVYDALAAIAVGLTCKVPAQKIAAALAEFKNTGDRQRTFEKDGYTVIADCYNAGPESMEAALQILADKPASGRKIAVLGDMLELGLITQAAHYELGKKTAAAANMVFAYGSNAMRVVAGAIDAGMPEEDARCYDSHTALLADLRRNARKGDILLFKGSHGMHMEQVMAQFFEK